MWDGLRRGGLVPVLTLTAIILAVWYLACLPMNRDLPQLVRVEGLANRYEVAWSLERPVLPAPHQIIGELYASTIGTRLLRETADGLVLNPRNLLTHAWVTISATLAGFVIGVLLGIALAVAIVHVNALRRSLMPWIVGEPEHSDPGHCADHHRRARLGRHRRPAAEGNDLGLSLVLSGHHRHGQGPDLARRDAARSDAHL